MKVGNVATTQYNKKPEQNSKSAQKSKMNTLAHSSKDPIKKLVSENMRKSVPKSNVLDYI